MLKNLHPLLSADVLHLLASMGHGDDLVVVDANHPAVTVASATNSGTLVRLPGVRMEEIVEAVLTVFPLDTFVDDPIRRMEPVDRPEDIPEVQADVAGAVARTEPDAPAAVPIERFAFYGEAKKAFGVIQVGDARPYGCFLFRKGVVAPADN